MRKLCISLLMLLLQNCACNEYNYDYDKNAVSSDGATITQLYIDIFEDEKFIMSYECSLKPEENGSKIIYLNKINIGYTQTLTDVKSHLTFTDTTLNFLPKHKYYITASPGSDCTTKDIVIETGKDGAIIKNN